MYLGNRPMKMKMLVAALLFALLSSSMTAPAMDNAEVHTYFVYL